MGGGGGYYGVKQLRVAAFLIAPFPSADARFWEWPSRSALMACAGAIIGGP